jgi:hypothetical protein
MHLPTRVRFGLAGLAITGGATAALILGPAGPALAFFSPPLLLEIQVNSPATLVARGAGVDVSLTIECAGARTASVFVSLTERVGKGLASGSGSAEIGCTDANETVQVTVTAVLPGKAFAKGTALANGQIGGCTPNFSICGSEQDQPTIHIRR